MKSRIVASGIAAGVMIGAAQGEVLLIDFGNDTSFRGASVVNPDSNGNHWTSVWSGAFYENILNSDGVATQIDFGFSSATGTDSFNGPAGTSTNPADSVYDAAALGNLGVDEAVFDFYVTSTFQIQNLDQSKTYDLTFYGAHKFNNDNTTRYTAYTDATFSTAIDSVDLLVGVNENHNEEDVVTLTGLTPDADGIIYIGFAGANGGDGYLNAMQIDVIPAPGALALLGLGGVCAARRRRA